MAIKDMKGTVTTTGMMNQNQQMPTGKVDPKLPEPVVNKPKAQPTPKPTPEQNHEVVPVSEIRAGQGQHTNGNTEGSGRRKRY